jgi:hypothetical protein
MAIVATAGHASAQGGAIAQAGPVTPYHMPTWFQNGVQGDGGQPATPYISALGLFGGASCPLGVSSQPSAGAPPSTYALFTLCQSDTVTAFTLYGTGSDATPYPSINAGWVMAGSPPVATGSCAIATQVGGNAAGSFKSSGGCSGGTIILTFATTNPTGWACWAQDMTTPADTIKQTAYTATSVTFTATMAANDQAVFKCMGF